MPQKSERIKKWCKFHNKECLWTPKGTTCVQRRTQTREKFKSRIVIPEKKECIVCNIVLPSMSFHKDNTTKCGLKGACKTCVKTRDYARYNTWEGYIQKKVVASWRAHRNEKRVNKLELHQAFSLLHEQNYICKHCGVELECTIGTQIKKNYFGASLDRINVDIVGYGNGNAQWLCMSCNNGKNTMDNEHHLQKFKKRDDKIKALEQEIKRLRKLLNKHGIKDKDAVQRLNVGGSSS